MNSRRVAACLGVYTPRRDFRNEKANEGRRFAQRRTGFGFKDSRGEGRGARSRARRDLVRFWRPWLVYTNVAQTRRLHDPGIIV